MARGTVLDEPILTNADPRHSIPVGPPEKAALDTAQILASPGKAAYGWDIGSDAPAVPYGLGVHFELGLLAAAGLPNDQALRIATAEGALALGLERQIGTLEEGKIADFVVIDGDPLERLTDTLRITAVVRVGRLRTCTAQCTQIGPHAIACGLAAMTSLKLRTTRRVAGSQSL